MARPKIAFSFRAVTVICSDLDRSRHFYQKVLGAEGITRDLGCPWFQLGSLQLTLMRNASEPSPARFPDHAMPVLWLEVDDLPAAIRHFERHKVEIVHPTDGQFIMIADPDGLVIEVWQKEQEDSGGNNPP